MRDATHKMEEGESSTSHPAECLCEACCRRQMKRARAQQTTGTSCLLALASDHDNHEDDCNQSQGGNTLDVTDMAMMGVVIANNNDRGCDDLTPSGEAADTSVSGGTSTGTVTGSHPTGCLCEACCRAQMMGNIVSTSTSAMLVEASAAGEEKKVDEAETTGSAAGNDEEHHPNDCECEECCRKLMAATREDAALPQATNNPNDGSGGGGGGGRVAAAHHPECLCEHCCRDMALRNIAAQDERDRKEFGRVEEGGRDEDESDKEDEYDEEDAYYDYEYDYSDYRMYGWDGTDTNDAGVGGGVGGGAVRRSKVSGQRVPAKSSTSNRSRSTTKRRRTDALRTSLPAATTDPVESLRQALLVHNDLGILQNRGVLQAIIGAGILQNHGVLQAIIDAISAELLEYGFVPPGDRVRMTDIAQLARQVMDTTSSSKRGSASKNGTLVAGNAKKKKKPATIAKKASTTKTTGNKKQKKQKKSPTTTTIPPAASAGLSDIGTVASTGRDLQQKSSDGGAGNAILASGRSRFGDRKRRGGRSRSRSRSSDDNARRKRKQTAAAAAGMEGGDRSITVDTGKAS